MRVSCISSMRWKTYPRACVSPGLKTAPPVLEVMSTMGAGTVLDAIRAGGMRIADVRTEEADLEDVFLQLTSKAREPSSAA